MKHLVVLLFFLLLFPSLTIAQTNNSALLQSLLKQLSELQAQLRELKGETTPNSTACALTRNLYQGLKGDDVTCIQRFLTQTGDYTYSEITGFYGEATVSAVKRFQARNGIVSGGDTNTTGYGALGPKTRTFLSMYRTPTTDDDAPKPKPRKPRSGGGGGGGGGGFSANDSCTLDSVTLDHGESQSFYKAKTVPTGSVCVAQTRSCNDGTIEGSAEYKYASCTVIGSPANTPPTISTITKRTTTVGTALAPITFTIGDKETTPASLTLTKASSNPTLIPLTGIVFGGSNANRTVTLTPAPTKTGTSTVTVTVTDGSGHAKTSSFVVVVNIANPNPPNPPTTDCDEGWTLIPKNNQTGTPDFCIMKFEAQNPRRDLFSARSPAGSEPAEPKTIVNSQYLAQTPISGISPSESNLRYPWVYITQEQAVTACKRIGDGAHLVTLPEAQAVSQNLLLQSLNWVTNKVGQGCMYGGHLDLNPNAALAAPTGENTIENQYQFTNDTVADASEGGPNNACFTRSTTNEIHSNGKLSRRSMVLSTNDRIWDWSGNAWEFLGTTAKNNNNGNGSAYVWTGTSNGSGFFDYNPADHPPSGDPARPAPLYTEWTKFYLQDYESPTFGPRNSAVPGTQLLDSKNGIGMYFGPMTNGNAIYRGGGVYHGSEGGIFQTHMSHTTVFNHPYSGFRCAKPPND